MPSGTILPKSGKWLIWVQEVPDRLLGDVLVYTPITAHSEKLDAILAVGCRVRSPRGVQFRAQRVKETTSHVHP